MHEKEIMLIMTICDLLGKPVDSPTAVQAAFEAARQRLNKSKAESARIERGLKKAESRKLG